MKISQQTAPGLLGFEDLATAHPHNMICSLALHAQTGGSLSPVSVFQVLASRVPIVGGES